jgi:hypothetical protein
VSGTPDPPIPDVLPACWLSGLSPGPYDHNVHKTTVLILVGAWRLSMSWRTSPLDSRRAFTLASPLGYTMVHVTTYHMTAAV